MTLMIFEYEPNEISLEYFQASLNSHHPESPWANLLTAYFKSLNTRIPQQHVICEVKKFAVMAVCVVAL